MLTVYGIETCEALHYIEHPIYQVATVLTVYGIETSQTLISSRASFNVATVLTVYGIETIKYLPASIANEVATVLTVYGIETLVSIDKLVKISSRCNSAYRLRY